MKKYNILILLLLITANIFSQEVNFRRVQNSMVIDQITGDTLSRHSSDAEAQQQLINWQLKGKQVKMIGSIYEVDIEDQVTQQIIDTIYVGDDWTGLANMKVIDTVQVLAFRYGNILSPNRLILHYYYDVLVVSKDTTQQVPEYTFTANLERTKSWPDAMTTYKLADIPFQFYKSDSIYAGSSPTEIKSRTFGSTIHCIKHYINGIEQKGGDKFESVACNPGSSTYAGGSFRHTNTFYNIDRTKENIIRVEALDIESGNIIGSKQFIIPKE